MLKLRQSLSVIESISQKENFAIGAVIKAKSTISKPWTHELAQKNRVNYLVAIASRHSKEPRDVGDLGVYIDKNR